jgi:PAS domain S-box-containing protein
VAIVVALSLQLALLPRPASIPFVFIYLAVATSAWLGGRGPGLLAVALGAILGNDLFLGERNAWAFAPSELVGTLLFAFSASLIAVLIGSLRRALDSLAARSDEARALNDQLSLAFAVGKSGSFWWDARSDTNVWSSQLLAIYGFAPGEFGGRQQDWLDTLLLEDRAAVEAAVREALRTGAFEREFRIRRRDTGEVRWLEGRAQVFFDEHQRPERMVGINVDVTERKREAEERARLAAIVDATDDAVLTKDASGTIVTWNDGARRTLGFRADEVVGRSVSLLIPPELIAEEEAFMARLAAGERIEHYQTIRLTKTGERRFVSASISPLRAPDGSLVAAATIMRDVTEQRRATEALRASEEKAREAHATLEAFFAAAPGALVVYDERLCFLDTDAVTPTLFGLDRATIRGKSLGDLASDLAERIEPVLREVIETRTPVLNLETRARTPSRDGGPAWYRASFFPVPIAGGRRGVGAIAVDITDIKRADSALREEDRRKNDFLAMLSHELRNPLAPIRNSVFVLGRSAAHGPQGQRALAIIDRQVQHLTRLVDDLLDVTRISRGKIRLQREPLDLQALLRRVVDDHRSIFERAGVRLALTLPRTNGDGHALRVRGDPTRLAQIVGNLLSNAVKFTPRAGHVSVSLSLSDQGAAEIRVRDDGAGIAKEVASTLFDPFVQAEHTLDRSRGGLGLGLALVRGLAELHGGSVRLQSAGLGRGSEFVVRLPLDRDAEKRSSTLPPPPSGEQASRVLIIEDNADAAESLKEALELSEHVVDVASAGPEGVEKARSLHPDLVLCDLGLPGMDGYEVARALRRDPSLRDVYLVALSGYASPEDVDRARAAGFDRHVAKPVELSALERVLTEVPARAHG